MGRAEAITRAVKTYDRELYCERNKEGKLCIFRKSIRWESFQLEDNVVLRVARPAPHLVFTLTDNWRPQGRPVNWGVLPILAHLRECDLHNRDIVSELEKQDDKHREACARESRNQAEAFASEFRSDFKKAFADVNTSNFKKVERKRKDEEKYGNN